MPVTNAETDLERNEKFRQAIVASLRCQPDVLMIGDVRDRSAARLAVEAAATGRVVWTSVHCNGALSVPGRLRDLAQIAEGADLADVNGIISQRLVPTLCPNCKVPLRRSGDEALLAWLEGVAPSAVDGAHVANPCGCPECRDGYAGRTVVGEVLEGEDLAAALRAGARSEAARELKARGWLSMFRHAISKVKDGTVSPRDVLERVGDDDGL